MSELFLMNKLPNDIIEKIWKIYYSTYVVPLVPTWKPIHGCLVDTSISYYGKGFLTNIIHWASQYLHTFWPTYMKLESREFCKYLETHKYCWVDTMYIELHGINSEDVKLEFQKHFKYIEVCDNKIRIDFKSYIQDWVSFILHECDIDMCNFEWKPLTLHIDGYNEIGYFEDPYTRQKSRRYYDIKYNYNYNPGVHIPWFVFLA